MLSGYVYVDMTGRDVGGYVEDMKRAVSEKVELPTGYTLAWSGQYEFMQRAQERLKIFVLFYFTFKSVGGIWYLALLGYNMSISVWVGLIALAGVAPKPVR